MFAFIVGTGRCGTTLVHEALCRHPATGFVSNIDDKMSHLNLSGRWNGPLYRKMAPRDPSLRPFRDRRTLIERGRLRIAPSEAWEVLDRQVFSGFSRPCRDLLASDATPYIAGRLRDFFERRRDAQQCDVLVHRVTGWPRTGMLRAVFPDARFINIVRDGRAVANSWVQMGWWDGYRGPSNWWLGPLPEAYQEIWESSQRSFPVLAGLGWRLLIDAFDEARASVPADQWLDFRYEDVIADPMRAIDTMREFLGLDKSPEFEAGLQRHSFPTSRRAAYLRDLDPANLGALQDAIAEPLRAWGYELLDVPNRHTAESRQQRRAS